MGRLACTALLLIVTSTPAFSADKRDPLTEARTLYNQLNFEGALAAAERARLVPTLADRADLIAARAYLERYRTSSEGDDLSQARLRLGRLNPQRLSGSERLEFIVGLGEALYFDESYGAAADVFGSVLDGKDILGREARERVLDWWAGAIDHQARPRPDIDRQVLYERIRQRMDAELGAYPDSGTAAFWLAAAARGKGDLQAAWDAAEAGWVRAPLAGDRGLALRADLDRLMERAIIPERARMIAQPAETLRADWERFKATWTDLE